MGRESGERESERESWARGERERGKVERESGEKEREKVEREWRGGKRMGREGRERERGEREWGERRESGEREGESGESKIFCHLPLIFENTLICTNHFFLIPCYVY